MQLPTQFAHVAHSQSDHRHARQGDFPTGEPSECIVGEVGIGEAGEDLSALWPGDGQNASVLGDVGDGDVFTLSDVMNQPITVVELRGDAGVEIVAILGKFGDGHLRLDSPETGEEVGESHSPWFHRHLVGSHSFEEAPSVFCR